MRKIKNTILNQFIKSDMLIINKYKKEKNIYNIFSYYTLLKNIKQLIRLLKKNKNMPLFLICRNKQQKLLLNKYFKQSIINNKMLIITLKTALIIKKPCIFLLFDFESTESFVKKLSTQNYKSFLVLITNNLINQVHRCYSIMASLNNLKQFLFIIVLIKKLIN